MNDWNSLETQLRSWQPRPPSAAVEEKLFSRPKSERPRRGITLHVNWQSGWAAGLATCLILAFTLLNLTQSVGISTFPGVNAAAVVSNTSYASSFVQLEHNCVSAPIFGWTSASGLPSSIRSFDLLNTNHLLP
jgi:hypothetical protein